MATALWLWRHPRAQGAAGRCIGRTDLAVDPRRAKRLAHRIRRCARLHGLPRQVWTSPLQRCHAVGRWLARWGWRHHVDARLTELDFGAWDGRPWTQIPPHEFAPWEADLLHHAPGGGEALASLIGRVADFCADAPPQVLVVAHAGWMQAAALCMRGPLPPRIDAAAWPRPPKHEQLLKFVLGSADADAYNCSPLFAPVARHPGGAGSPCPDSMNSPSASNGSCCATRN